MSEHPDGPGSTTVEPGGPADPGGPVEPIDADASVVAGEEPPSSRTALSRDRVVTAALDYVDEHGLAGLTMRRLGTRLGVEAMALYRHVPGKEALLDAIVEQMLARMSEDPDVVTSPEHGWQDFVQRLAHGVRRVALAHPRGFPLVASRPAEAPWLRPPLRDLAWVERFLSGLVEQGFSPDAAVAAYRAFTSFLLGHLLLEVAGRGADLGPIDVVDDGSVEVDGLDSYPTVEQLRGALSQDHAAEEFEEALESLIDRLSLALMEDTP